MNWAELTSVVNKYTDLAEHCSDDSWPTIDNRYHYCYCMINKINKKFYIGKRTSNVPIDLNYYGSGGPYYQNALNKYGKENFFRIILSYHHSESNALKYEKYLITDQMIISPECYNIKPGGSSFDPSIFERMRSGINPGAETSKNLAKLGLHNAQIETKNGVHHFCGESNPNNRRMKDGTHHFIGKSNPVYFQLANNTHPWQVKPWYKNSATYASKVTWFLADEIRILILKYSKLEYYKYLFDYFPEYRSRWSGWSLGTVIRYLDEGWIPYKDLEWIDFRNNFNSLEGIVLC